MLCEIATRTHLFRPYNSKDTSFFVAHNFARSHQVNITDGMEQTYSISMIYARYRGSVRAATTFSSPSNASSMIYKRPQSKRWKNTMPRDRKLRVQNAIRQCPSRRSVSWYCPVSKRLVMQKVSLYMYTLGRRRVCPSSSSQQRSLAPHSRSSGRSPSSLCSA